MSMRMNIRAPVAQLAAPCRSSLPAVPRKALGSRHSSFFSGTSGSFKSISARMNGPVRSSRLLVEAAKKSVGDLGKSELEGKVVLVRY